MKVFKENINKFFTILIYIIVCYVFSDLLRNVLINYVKDNLVLATLVNLIPYVILTISTIILLRGEIVLDFKRLGKSDAFMVFKICAMGVVSAYFANMLGSMVSQLFGGTNDSANQQGVSELILSKYGLVFALITIFLAPIVEELVFRKALHGFLRSYKMPNGFILLISSCLFGLIHVIAAGDFVYIFPYIFMGVVLGGLELNTRSIFPSVIVHMFNNGVAFFMTIILDKLQPLLPQF